MENYSQRFLIVIEGPNEGRVYPLQNTICTLGRTADNTVVIDSARISRRHTQIQLLPEGAGGAAAIIEDMGSTNGTWVNYRQLTGPHQLMPGDVITLADYITFRYEIEDTHHTEKLAPTLPHSATQVIDDAPTYTPPPAYETPYPTHPESAAASTQQPFIKYDSAPQMASPAQPTPAPQRAPAAPPAKRSKWVYSIVAILLILICICLAVAVYLWFAPVTFWESVFELFNIPIP